MEKQVDLSTMSISDCKALAYDLMVQLQAIQNNLQVINQEIAKKSQKEQDGTQTVHPEPV